MKLSIIIPCYNESKSIQKLINNCNDFIQPDIEIIFVDNGSTDNTYKTLINYNLPTNFKIIRVENNIGYGNGIIKGLENSIGEAVSWTHADLQTDIGDVIRGYNQYKKEIIEKKCLVKGERKKRNLFDSFFTFCMGLYCTLILRIWLFDINAQPKIFHRNFLKKFKNPPLDFSLDLFLVYWFKSNKLKINTFPVSFKKREFGEAKGGGTFYGKLKLIKRTFKYIHTLKKNLI